LPATAANVSLYQFARETGTGVGANGGWEEKGPRRRLRPRAAAFVAAAGLIVAAAVLARGGISAPDSALDVDTDPSAPEETLPGRPQPDGSPGAQHTGWAPMAAAPFSLRVAPPVAWTGDELVVWTGDSQQPGGVFHAREDRWERLPPAPIERVAGWTAVWTGEEVVYWGGAAPGGERPVDGAAFAPARRAWRQVAAAPIVGRVGAAAVATPDAIIVWGGQQPRGAADGERVLADGAAYDPSSDTWSPLPAAPLSPRADPVAVWTGTHVLVWGGRGDTQSPEAWLSDGALFDPSSGEWAAMDPLPVEFSFPPAIAWAGEQLLVWGLPAEGLHLSDGWAFDVGTRSWSPLPSLLNQERAHASAAWPDRPAATAAAGAGRGRAGGGWGGRARPRGGGRPPPPAGARPP
jgi:hypothetical protein